MDGSVKTRSASRAQLAKGILKALFTTSPKEPTQVVVSPAGSVEVTTKPEDSEPEKQQDSVGS